MVEFCGACGTSLPGGDLTIKGGQLFTSHDYDCPSCRKPANPDTSPAKAASPDVAADRDVVIRRGSITRE